jgi:clan AA aspartic protease
MQVKVEILVYNFIDEELSKLGIKRADEIRRLKVPVIVDSGATTLTLPEDKVEQLGLRLIRKVKTRYADGRITEKWIASAARVELLGRSATTDVIVEKKDTKPLLGHVPMELMDLTIDPKLGKVTTREESPDMPLIEQLWLEKGTKNITIE